MSAFLQFSPTQIEDFLIPVRMKFGTEIYKRKSNRQKKAKYKNYSGRNKRINYRSGHIHALVKDIN